MGIRIKRFMFVCICLLWGMIITAHCQSVLVEAELFKNKGGWSVDTQFIDQMGSPYLLAHGLGEAVKDAVTAVSYTHLIRLLSQWNSSELSLGTVQ